MPEPIVTLNEESLKTDLRELPARSLPDPRMRGADTWTPDSPDPADTGETVLVDRIPIPEA